jgi:hypothetical protein
VSKLEQWLKSGEYLPSIMRDFHDQKDIFKTIHETINVEGHDYAKEVNWIAGQCYVIDIFLWWMARRGYTLQRSRAKQEFVSLSETLRQQEAQRMSAIKAVFGKAK